MFSRLKDIFSSKPKVNIESFGDFAVDMHSHLIAGIDDGVKTVEEAVEIIRKMKDLGYKKIITTPHIMSGGYNNSPETILPGLEKLREALQKAYINFPIEAAAEYYLDGNFEKLIAENKLLTFGDNHVLFELSYMYRPSGFESTVFELNASGYKPILAHPERYPYFFDKNLTMLKEVKDTGVYFQLNLFSLLGVYGRLSQEIARKLVDEEMVDFVGTDIHNSLQLGYLERCRQSSYVQKLLNNERLLNKTLLN
jgi:protein-tyrosine phosphatase